MVRIRLDPRSRISCCQSAGSNSQPRSVVIVDGTPKCAIQPLRKVRDHCLSGDAADGNSFWPASELSTQMEMYVDPLDGGRGPTMSLWILLKRALGFANVERG